MASESVYGNVGKWSDVSVPLHSRHIRKRKTFPSKLRLGESRMGCKYTTLSRRIISVVCLPGLLLGFTCGLWLLPLGS